MAPPNTIQWTDWPARRQPLRSTLAALVIAVGTGAVASLDPWLAFVGALLLLTATAEILLPTRFGLDAEGVTLDNPLRRSRRTWDRFGAWARTDDGFFLIGAAGSPLLRRRASVQLRCQDRIEEITAALTAHLGEART